MKSPLFSVCVPIYNGADHLAQCFTSIMNQTFQDFEIIVVDDGSTDGSINIIEEFQSKDKRIRFFKNEVNLGLVKNWNQCIEHSKGRWIKFLFQDDFWEIDCLENLHSECEGHNFIFHARNFLIEDDVEISLKNFYTSDLVCNNSLVKNLNQITNTQISKLIAENFGFNFFGEPSNIAFTKDVVLKLGFFDVRLVHLCDYEYWCRVATNFGCYYIPKKMSTFRVHQKSTSVVNVLSKRFRYEYLDRLIILHDFRFNNYYSKLRQVSNESAPAIYKRLYQDQAIELVIFFIINLNRKEELEREISQYAPFAKKLTTTKNLVSLYLLGVIKKFVVWLKYR